MVSNDGCSSHRSGVYSVRSPSSEKMPSLHCGSMTNARTLWDLCACVKHR